MTTQQATPADTRIKILILGENYSGKTSLIDILTRRDIPPLSWDIKYKDYTDTENAPVTYTSDKYVITDTRGLDPNFSGLHRKEMQRIYMERIKDGFNIVLVVFNTVMYDRSDPNIIPAYKVLFPELVDIMHVIIVAWENRPRTDEFLLEWVGTTDVLKLKFPAFRDDLSEEHFNIFQQTRMESLNTLENFIQLNATKQLHRLSPEIGAQIMEDFTRIRAEIRESRKPLYKKILPWVACIGAIGLFVFCVKKLEN